MQTYIIHIILLALCYSNMFRLSNGHFQGARLIYLHSQIGKMCTGCKIQFIEQHVYYVTRQCTEMNERKFARCIH